MTIRSAAGSNNELMDITHSLIIPEDMRGLRLDPLCFASKKDLIRLYSLLGPRICCAYFKLQMAEVSSPSRLISIDWADPRYCRDIAYAPWRNSILSKCNVLGAYMLKNPFLVALLLQASSGDISVLKIPRANDEHSFTENEIAAISSLDDALFSEDCAGHRFRDFKDLLESYEGEVVPADRLCEFNWACRVKIDQSSIEENCKVDIVDHYQYFLAEVGCVAEVPADTQQRDRIKAQDPGQPKGCHNYEGRQVSGQTTVNSSNGLPSGNEVNSTARHFVSKTRENPAEMGFGSGTNSSIRANGDSAYGFVYPQGWDHAIDVIPHLYDLTCKMSRIGVTVSYIGENFSFDKYQFPSSVAYDLNIKGERGPKELMPHLIGFGASGLTHILKNGYPYCSLYGANDLDRYITQAAIYVYLSEIGIGQLSETFLKSAPDPYSIKSLILKLVENARLADKADSGHVVTLGKKTYASCIFANKGSSIPSYITLLPTNCIAVTNVGFSGADSISNVDLKSLCSAYSDDLKKLAVIGNSSAQLAIARAYNFGTGVERSLRTARYWYRKALENGEKMAEQALRDF